MADPKEINYAGGQKILNKELTEQKIDEAVSPVASALSNEVSRAQGAETELDGKITDVAHGLATEIQNRQTADGQLQTQIGELSSLETINKNNLVGAINEVLNKIPEEQTVDTEMSDTSTHTVQNKVIKKYVDDADIALQEQIDDINDTLDDILPADEVPTEGSEKVAKSGGTFDAIHFASVKVGETMFWHKAEIEDRIVRSDEQFNFMFRGQLISVTPVDGQVTLIISKEVPEGWHACDGKAELNAADYPDLAAFMPENVTNEGKIWLPYAQQKIIKVKY